jgi:hypothetical protein
MYPNLYPFSISRYIDITFTMWYAVIEGQQGGRADLSQRVESSQRTAANAGRIRFSRNQFERRVEAMLRSVKDLRSYTVRATDGDIGEVHEFYFDDLGWAIRYLVADTGSWLSGRRVLLSTVSLGQPKWEKRMFPVLLNKEQVEHSPDIATDKPASQMSLLSMLPGGWARTSCKVQ